MNQLKPTTNDNLLYVDSSGTGPVVILLHGWGMHGGYWQGLVSELHPNYRLHCIDLPGHGKSDYDGEQNLDDFVRRIQQTIDSLTDQPFYLVGWSLGGLIAQRLSLDFPERIKKLILIASSPSFVQRQDWPHAMDINVLGEFAGNLQQNYKTTLSRFIALQVRGSTQAQQGLRELKAQLFSRGEPDPTALKAGLGLLQQVDLRTVLPMIQQPVLLLGGEHDTLAPQAALTAAVALLPHATLHVIKGAGHAPFLSHPTETINLIQAFIEHE